MIIPMKKYTFLVFHKEYEEFLGNLQKLGVIHVQQKKAGEFDEEALKDKIQLLKRYNDAIKFLSNREVEKIKNQKFDKEGIIVLGDIEQAKQDIEAAHQKIAVLQKEFDQNEPWGEYSTSTLNQLQENGYMVRFYVSPAKDFKDEWRDNPSIFIITETGSETYFVSISKEIDVIEAEPINVSTRSLSEIKAEVTANHQLVAQQHDKLNNYAAHYIEQLSKARDALHDVFSFEHAKVHTHAEAESSLLILEGFAPINKTKELDAFIETNGIVFFSDDATNNDKPPILLKNNKFARKFEPLGELYSMPAYNELDLTPFFAPFYMIFFGFCLGDLGYGILMVLAAIFLRKKVAKEMRGMLMLAVYLGISTMFFGIIGGTFFGINLYETSLPGYTQVTVLLKSKGIDINTVLFYLSLALGAIQIMFGMFLKAFNEIIQLGIRYAFATIGWIILILGGSVTVILVKLKGIPFEQLKIPFFILAGISGVLILILNNPKRNVIINIGAGLWDTYNMVTGLLGDLLSYIRLFALGISTSILGFVFNSLAISMSGDIPVVSAIIMVIILLFGHSINLFMSGLGSFVHPMRLTFVEFYKNSGFSGGGKKYNPFRKLT